MDYTLILVAIIVSFALGMLIAPLVMFFTKKLKAEQKILQYVDNHYSKDGTPTMGGIIFILPACITALCFAGFKSKLALVSVLVTFCYGILGFLDDFIKVKFKHNLGLKAYQKVIGQVGIAVIVTIFCRKYHFLGGVINLPFSDATINLQWWYIPFCLLIFLATTNAVNLTDGLDGLAGSTSCVSFGAFLVIILIQMSQMEKLGETVNYHELRSLSFFCASMIGGIFAFLWLNSHPAKIFMGDTGSMALGAGLACVGIFSKNPLIILLVGIMYIVSCISVIIQVIYFKATKKRVFLMAPFHHHLEYKGVKETKIVAWYVILTAIFSLIAIISISV